MTIKIEIEAHPDRGDMGMQVERAMSALGFVRGVPFVPAEVATATGAPYNGKSSLDPEEGYAAVAEAAPVKTETEEAPKRERGKPSAGRARRTKDEIAEDEAADAAGHEPVTIAHMKMLPDDASPEQVAKEFAAISTGEARVGPDDEQDAADEAAETEKTGLAPIDVLRRLVGDYQKKNGMPAAVKLCQEGGIIGKPIHELDDAGIDAAIAAMRGNSSVEAPVKREETAKLEPKTKADLIEAMMLYGDKFDGTREQAKMVHTLADCPRIFAEVFGADVSKLSQVPEDGYAEAVAAIMNAIATDPYGRAK